MSYDYDYFSGLHLKLPSQPAKPTLGRNPSAIEARAFADALEDYERAFRSYEEDKSYYQSQISALHHEFTDKLKADYGLSDEEFDVIWSEAYDRGHAYGLEEVASHFGSLYDFALKYAAAAKRK
jgi:ClpP class serine protease